LDEEEQIMKKVKYLSSSIPRSISFSKDFDYLNKLATYTAKCDNISDSLVADLDMVGSLEYGLNIMHIIISRDNIGMNLKQFSRVFNILLPSLQEIYSHSLVSVPNRETRTNNLCSLRMRLFLTLYRMKNG